MRHEGALVQRLRVRDGFFRNEAGSPIYLAGANFWPKRTGPWMYRDPWDPDAVSNDLTELAALGTNVVRIFCFTPDFMPSPDVVSTQAIERLDSTVDLAAKAGLWSIPTFLVGHMSGENWEADWARGRHWYTDPVLREASDLLVGTVASHFAGDPRIAAWLITNEWPLFAGRTLGHIGLAWAQRLCATLRAADPGCNISLGDGSWDVINGEQSGLPSPALRDVVDFFGPHFYPKETDSLRHSAFASFAMRMLEPLRHPILLEEFGCSSDQADDRNAAAYYRTVMWSAFGAGNCGTLFWNSHDFTVADRPPYSHHPYELHFGVIRTDGSLKPQAAEVKRFTAFTAKHGLDDLEAIDPLVAIGRTSYYLSDFPFDWAWRKPELRDLFLQTYATCMRSGFDATFWDIGTTPAVDARLLLVPCLQAVTTGDAKALENFARNGGCVYLSYGGEPWFPDLARFIGAQPLIRYGLVAAAPRDEVRLTFTRHFGNLAAGSTLSITPRGELRRRSPLLCQPRDASVIATDDDGNPALFERRLDKGHVVFMAYPLEYYPLAGLDANRSDETWKLYRALAHRAGAMPDVHTASGVIQAFEWRSKSTPSRRRVMLVNHAWEAIETDARGVGEDLIDAETGERCSSQNVRLESKGVRVFDVSRS